MVKFFKYLEKFIPLSSLFLFIATLVSLIPMFKYNDLILKFPRLRSALWINR